MADEELSRARDREPAQAMRPTVNSRAVAPGTPTGRFRPPISLAYRTPVASDYERLSRDPAQPRRKSATFAGASGGRGTTPRRGSSDPAPFSEAERQNLESFAGMLDEAIDQDRLIKAEALRELGRFEDAVRLLARDIDPRMKRAATFIGDLALNQAITRPRNCISRTIGSRAHEGLLRVRPDSFPRRVLM